MKRKAHYPVTHNQIKTFTVSLGSQQISIDNAFLGPIPERILIGLVKNTAFVVSPSTNPFHSHHYDMTNLALYVEYSTHPNRFQWIALHTSEPPELTRHYFRVLVYTMMIVLT